MVNRKGKYGIVKSVVKKQFVHLIVASEVVINYQNHVVTVRNKNKPYSEDDDIKNREMNIMFRNLTLGKCLKFATGVWLINIMIAWIYNLLFND